MVENKTLREEQDRDGSSPGGVYDYAYFRTKFGISTAQVMEAIKEAHTNSPVELEEYLAEKYNLSKDDPDRPVI
jgi:hypothetical protein